MAVPGENVRLPSTEVSWLQRDLLLFAASIGVGTDELNLVFVSSGQNMNVSEWTLSQLGTKRYFRSLSYISLYPAYVLPFERFM